MAQPLAINDTVKHNGPTVRRHKMVVYDQRAKIKTTLFMLLNEERTKRIRNANERTPLPILCKLINVCLEHLALTMSSFSTQRIQN